MDNAEIQKAMSLSLEKFNKESSLANRFALLKVTRATAGVRFPHVLNTKTSYIYCTYSEQYSSPTGYLTNLWPKISYCYAFLFVSLYVCVQMAMSMYYHVEYTIQETTCSKSTEAVTADKCPLMECEFAVSHDKFWFHILTFEHFILIKWTVYFNFQIWDIVIHHVN